MRVVSEIDGLPVVSTTELSRLLGLTVSSTLLQSIGILPFAVMPNGVYWAYDEIQEIRETLASYLLGNHEPKSNSN